MKKWVFSASIAVAFIVVVALILYSGNNKLSTAPEISLNIIDGRQITLHSLQGKPLFVTFWATTCSTCVKEIPHLVELYNEIGKEELEIIAIAMPYDPPNLVVALSERKSIPYPVALDINGDAVKAFGNVQVTPTSFLIDSEGKIVQQHSGQIDMEELRTKVKAMLNTTTDAIS
jgi:peroxiredoxin